MNKSTLYDGLQDHETDTCIYVQLPAIFCIFITVFLNKPWQDFSHPHYYVQEAS